MQTSPVRKNKIVLTDYNYRQDIHNRLLMASLTPAELSLLRNIVDGSVVRKTSQLCEEEEIDAAALKLTLKKLINTKLFSEKNGTLSIDKEMRRYFECEVQKFDDNFEPGMEYLQGLLGKVPIHHLPSWYSIPRHSDHIFLSIIEKYLHTPKVYERYLAEMQVEDSHVQKVLDQLFQSKDYSISTEELRHDLNLSKEAFAEFILFMEFNFICCSSFQYDEECGQWKEKITPFHEWKEYQHFLQKTVPTTIENAEEVKKSHPLDFGFVHDMKVLLKAMHKSPIPLSDLMGKHILPVSFLERWFPLLQPPHCYQDHFTDMINTTIQLGLAVVDGDKLHALDTAKQWLKLTTQNQALKLYSIFINQWNQTHDDFYCAEREIRELEKNLKKIMESGWVYVDDFIGSVTVAIGNAEPVCLRKRGKRWHYAIPAYSEQEKEVLRRIILDLFAKVGIVALGTHDSKPCMTLTPFGRMTLET